MRYHRNKLFSCSCLAFGLATFGNSASAQTAASEGGAEQQSSIGIPEIIVTAQKRSENLQEVPIAITAVTSAALDQAGVQNTVQLQAVTPSLNITTSGGNATVLPRLRGVGSQTNGPGIENSVATYVDGVYIASASASLFTLSGVDHIEVLKGPQGTLFGRNATGGLINIITKNPENTLSGNADISYGNYQTFTGRAYFGGPISENVRANLSVQFITQGKGYGKNLATGDDNYRTYYDFAARSKWIFDLGDTTNLTVSGDYAKSKSAASYTPLNNTIIPPVFVPPTFSFKPYDAISDLPNKIWTEGGGGSLRLDQEIGNLTLVSITAYRKHRFNTFIDFDGGPLPVISVGPYGEKARQFTQEVQLLSPSTGPFKWILGGYYFDGSSRYIPNAIFFGSVFSFLPSSIDHAGQKTKSFAGFAQGDLELGEKTTVTAGVRYTKEDRDLFGTLDVISGGTTTTTDFTGLPSSSVSFNKVTFRLAVSHKFTDDILGYVSFNRGFKSGGYNANQPFSAPFRPEVLDAYEAGLKTDLIPGNLRLNLAGFYYDYSNIQVSRFVNGSAVILNGAKAKVYGGEAELEAVPTAGLRINAGLSWTHSEFTNFPNADIIVGCVTAPMGVPCSGSVKGNKLPYAPSLTGNLSVDYTLPLNDGSEIMANGNVYYNNGYTADPAATFRQDAYSVVNLALGWKSANKHLNASLWVRNLNDSRVINTIPFAAGIVAAAQWNPPRTYGATIGFEF